jgi:hypothetical protein
VPRPRGGVQSCPRGVDQPPPVVVVVVVVVMMTHDRDVHRAFSPVVLATQRTLTGAVTARPPHLSPENTENTSFFTCASLALAVLRVDGCTPTAGDAVRCHARDAVTVVPRAVA